VYEFLSLGEEALDHIVLNMFHLRNVRHLDDCGALELRLWRWWSRRQLRLRWA
jgi:hypothetical protein